MSLDAFIVGWESKRASSLYNLAPGLTYSENIHHTPLRERRQVLISLS